MSPLTRDIEFRAWDDAYKMMLYGVEHTYDTLKKYHKADGTEVQQWDTAFAGCRSFGQILETVLAGHLMQFTGLKDKNGRKIFEGDIVRAKRGYTEPMIGIVKYEGMAFSYIGKTASGSEWSMTITSPHIEQDLYVEVIGNIHENPELLKSNEKEKSQ